MRRPQTSDKPLINLDTGEVYTTSYDAGKSILRSRTAISIAIKESRACGGYRWAYYNPKKHAHLVKKTSKKAA